MTLEVDLSTSQTELGAVVTPGQPSMEPSGPTFGALKATIAFVLLFGAQFFTGAVVIVVATIVALARGRNVNDPGFANQLTGEMMVPLLLAAAVVSSVVVFIVARVWAWHLVGDKSSVGLGMVAPRSRHILSWAAGGAVVAAAYVVVSSSIIPFDSATPLGPLAAAASQGGAARIAWAVLALAFAPVVEEFFFRGLLLAGFAHTWGTRVGGAVVTVLFVLMHLFETFRYWPATVAVTLLAVGTLAARRMSGSLAPAVTFHGGYNLVIVVMAFVARGTA